jgi:hypothetical protein
MLLLQSDGQRLTTILHDFKHKNASVFLFTTSALRIHDISIAGGLVMNATLILPTRQPWLNRLIHEFLFRKKLVELEKAQARKTVF